MRKVVAFGLMLMSLSSASHAAEILAGGTIFGSLAQTRAVCTIFNAGTAVIGIQNLQIRDHFGTIRPQVIDQCGATLEVNKSCGVAADVNNQFAFSCKVTVSPNKTHVRGVLDLRDADQNVLSSVELR